MMRVSAWPLVTILMLGCHGQTPPTGEKVEAESPLQEASPIQAQGLHNVFRITDNLISGSSPDGELGMQSLKKLGIKTIISVDGAKPDIASASKYGMKYAHLPFGYDGIPRGRVLELAKAVRDLPGPIYIHCHHGKHRGPAAAAAIHLCLDPKCSVEDALAEMKRAGTDPHYTGLYAVPKNLVRPSTMELDKISAKFPEVAKVPGLAQLMVEIDSKNDNLKLIQAAGWKTPPDHADLDPAHESLQMLEQFREASRLEEVQKYPKEFRSWLAQAEEGARQIKDLLRPGKAEASADQAKVNELFRRQSSLCSKCHAKYRDVPP